MVGLAQENMWILVIVHPPRSAINATFVQSDAEILLDFIHLSSDLLQLCVVQIEHQFEAE